MTDDTIPPDEPDVPKPLPDGIEPIAIEAELKSSYLDYAMSVIVARALPDVRDGLKPVHRRILYTMEENGLTSDKAYRKCATVVGDVMGRYHPHGDGAVYDALVRLAQPWSMAVPLIDGQGNFGSIDGDPPAAYRYTECKLEKVASRLIDDIDKGTVDFNDNYDTTRKEPEVLPAQFPNLLVNGAGGIAVGMATNIPPHNLIEICNATLALIDDPGIDDDALLDIVPGPDFPTGGLIMGRSASRKGLMTGRASVVMRAKTDIEEARNGRQAIIVTEIPYQVNKATMITRIAELVREKKVEGISDLRDESDRKGIRVVIELKKDVSADVVLNQLYRFSQMQSSFGMNMLALNGGRPELMNLRKVLECFVTFREEVVVRRTKFELNKARDRAHTLVGLALAVANIDEVIRIIRNSPDPTTAREALLAKAWPQQDMGPLIDLIADRRTRRGTEDGTIYLSDEQARAILNLPLHRLTGLGRDEIGKEAKGLSEQIADLLDILRSRPRILDIIKSELIDVRDKFGVPRRSEFATGGIDMEDEDLIEVEDMVVTVTHGGYVKRTPLSTYRAQNRGGKGRAGVDLKDEDFVVELFSATTHTEVLFFSSTGMVYKEKVWRLPLGSPTSRGKALINIFPLGAGERIESVMPLPADEAAHETLDILFATSTGYVRRNKLADFTRVNRNGKIAMEFEEPGEGIVAVRLASEANDVLLTTALGQCIRFPVSDVRVFQGRKSTGVRGIRLGEGDAVISMGVLQHMGITSEEARAYLKHAAAQRRAENGEEDEAVAVADDEEEAVAEAALSPERIAELAAAEEYILTIADDGMGKRSSAYDYRLTGRGGKGLVAQNIWGRDRKGAPVKKVAQSFPVGAGDQVMLVTDKGQLIRTPVEQIRIAGRSTGGVWILRTSDGERVVSVARLVEDAGGAMDDNTSAK